MRHDRVRATPIGRPCHIRDYSVSIRYATQLHNDVGPRLTPIGDGFHPNAVHAHGCVTPKGHPERNDWMNAEEAKEYGLVGGIVSSATEV